MLQSTGTLNPDPPTLQKGDQVLLSRLPDTRISGSYSISKSRNKDSVQLWIQPQEIHLVYKEIYLETIKN